MKTKITPKHRRAAEPVYSAPRRRTKTVCTYCHKAKKRCSRPEGRTSESCVSCYDTGRECSFTKKSSQKLSSDPPKNRHYFGPNVPRFVQSAIMTDYPQHLMLGELITTMPSYGYSDMPLQEQECGSDFDCAFENLNTPAHILPGEDANLPPYSPYAITRNTHNDQIIERSEERMMSLSGLDAVHRVPLRAPRNFFV